MSINKPVVLFNIDGFNESENYPSSKDLNILKIPSEKPTIKYGTSTQGKNIRNIIENSNNLIEEIFDEAAEKGGNPIVNIQFDNNNTLLPDTDKAIERLKDLGIKVCFSFNHYNTEDEESNNYWKPRLATAHHTFFVKAEDQKAAIDKGHVTTTNSTFVQSISTSLNAKVKELDGEARIAVVDVPLDNADVITDLIMTKFNIASDNAIDKENLKAGILIEVTEILGDKDKVPEKLEKYISRISHQFEQDRNNRNNKDIYKENPIDIYLSLKPELRQNTYNMQQKLHEIQQENTARLEATLTQRVVGPAIQNSLRNVIYKPILEPEAINDLTKPEHLYHDYEITNIIKNSIDEKKVSVIDYSSLGDQELLKDTIKNSLQDLKDNKKDVILIPLNTGHEHWVSLAIKRDKNNNIEFIYNDPKGHSIYDRTELVDIIKEIAPNPTIRDLKILQQLNAKDCGPFVVYDLIKIAKGELKLNSERNSPGMGAKLRKEHNEINQKHLEIPPAEQEKNRTNAIIQALTTEDKTGLKPLPFSSKVVNNRPLPKAAIRTR